VPVRLVYITRSQFLHQDDVSQVFLWQKCYCPAGPFSTDTAYKWAPFFFFFFGFLAACPSDVIINPDFFLDTGSYPKTTPPNFTRLAPPFLSASPILADLASLSCLFGPLQIKLKSADLNFFFSSLIFHLSPARLSPHENIIVPLVVWNLSLVFLKMLQEPPLGRWPPMLMNIVCSSPSSFSICNRTLIYNALCFARSLTDSLKRTILLSIFSFFFFFLFFSFSFFINSSFFLFFFFSFFFFLFRCGNFFFYMLYFFFFPRLP